MMKTLIEDAVCGTHSMRKAFAVVSAEIREKLSDQFAVGNNSRRPRAQPLRSSWIIHRLRKCVDVIFPLFHKDTHVVFIGGLVFSVWHETIPQKPGTYHYTVIFI